MFYRHRYYEWFIARKVYTCRSFMCLWVERARNSAGRQRRFVAVHSSRRGQVRCETCSRQLMIFMRRCTDRHYDTRRTRITQHVGHSVLFLLKKCSAKRDLFIVIPR